jgi:elongation factor Tu
MRIDRISVVTGRGTLLEGTVARGTLRGNESVDILGPSKDTIHSTVLVVLISGTVRDQVQVGDYAGILVQNVAITAVSPGMLLAAAGGYDTHEEAIQELQ